MTLAHRYGQKRWNGGGKVGLYDYPIVANRSGHRDDRIHTTQKPLELMRALVEDFTEPDDIVIDFTCGSGTTGVACIQLGRRFIGIELSPEYAELSRRRLDAEDKQTTLRAQAAGQIPLLVLK
jgi:site-specific DNA-methyltransferase (adenine-specific)